MLQYLTTIGYILRYLAIIGFLLLTIAAVIWLVMCAVSAKARRDRGRLAKRLVVMALVSTPIVGFLLPAASNSWPPDWVRRRTQRHLILERVRSAGGWLALKRDCNTLVNSHKGDPYEFDYRWIEPDTSFVTPAIAALRPKFVQLLRLEGSNVVVRILIFGAHSTGGRDQPWRGLDVVCEPGVAIYRPDHLRSTTSLGHWTYRKLTDDVYEFY